MSFTDCLPVHSFEGKVGDVSIKWGANGTTNLPDNAKALDVDTNGLKAATEHLAVACATRLGKGSIRILGPFHETTTNRSGTETRPDRCHCSIALGSPGSLQVHIYVNLKAGIALEDLVWEGEGVVIPGKKVPDPNLSIGDYS